MHDPLPDHLALDPALGLRPRHLTIDDAPAVTDLINAVDQADYGASDMDVDEVADDLRRVALETDAWLLDGPDGPAAFADLTRRGGGAAWELYVAVLPAWRRRGIGATLVRDLEARARARLDEAPAGARVTIHGWIKGESAPERRWAQALGYAVQRQFLRMRIDMTEPPPPAEWPAGIASRTFVVGRDERATFDAVEEAFADHWGHLPAVYEDWVRRTESSTFDPGLWLLAVEGDEIVGTSLGSGGAQGGWIGGLGTRRAWRGRGVARAILLEHFRLFWERGMRTVQLGVDGQSLTGATRLYEKAGMRVVERYDQAAKVLREGRDLAIRALEG
jgi:mycothiol synthase